ncbi:MAG: hypothetical protein K6347_02455 [Campylobacterales bacterium]
MNEIKDIIIQCGITYQPLTIGIDLLQKTHSLGTLHLITTHVGIDAIKELMSHYFPHLSYRIYGHFVDGEGNAHDQAEFAREIQNALSSCQHEIYGLIASGTNWMTSIFSKLLIDKPLFVIQTQKEFKDRGFLPEEDKIVPDGNGNIVHRRQSISKLVPVSIDLALERFMIKDRTLSFMGRSVQLSLQEAAMYDYFYQVCQGSIDLAIDHTDTYNQWCETHPEYDNYRVFVEEFAPRFRQNISKINKKIMEGSQIVAKYLKIHKIDHNIFRLNTPWPL